MSISDTIDQLFSDNADTESALQDIADLMKRKYGQDLWFCALLGRRWGFRAGTSEILTGTYRQLLNKDWGIITDTIKVSTDVWQSICSCLKRNLEENRTSG